MAFSQELADRICSELAEALQIAMKEWGGWVDEARGMTPECPGWDRCKAALAAYKALDRG